MGMNLCHRVCCSSDYWARTVEKQLLPWALADVDLGDNTLEIGPGYGANMRVLVVTMRTSTPRAVSSAGARSNRSFCGGPTSHTSPRSSRLTRKKR